MPSMSTYAFKASVARVGGELADPIALMPKPVARPWGSVKHANAMAETPLAKTGPDTNDDKVARRP
jgi:hypothetical protein